jgi:hypothetical protein
VNTVMNVRVSQNVGSFCVAKELSAFQDGLCSIELVGQLE